MATHKLLTEFLTMALTCNQTRVFNMAYTNANSSTISA